jgi:hypothetical protein
VLARGNSALTPALSRKRAREKLNSTQGG